MCCRTFIDVHFHSQSQATYRKISMTAGGRSSGMPHSSAGRFSKAWYVPLLDTLVRLLCRGLKSLLCWGLPLSPDLPPLEMVAEQLASSNWSRGKPQLLSLTSAPDISEAPKQLFIQGVGGWLPDEVRMEAWSEQAPCMFLLIHFVVLGQRLVTAVAWLLCS